MEPHELPMLQEIFTELRKGRHLCIEDGAIYASIEENKDLYQGLFAALGLNLVWHNRGFYYLDDDSAPRSAQKIVLFTAILVEAWDDQGVNLDLDLTKTPISPSRLPHLSHEKYRDAMAEVEVKSEDALLKVLDSMKRYGLAEPDEDGIWHLRTSAYRLLDILNMAGREIRPASEIEGAIQ